MSDVKNLDYYRGLSYGITLRRDEDGDWVTRVEELPGCTAHGGTQTEALERLEGVKTAWIEDAIEAGDPVPEPVDSQKLPSGKWLQRVPRSLHKGLAEMAEKEGVSLNQLVMSVLAEALGKHKSGGAIVIVDSPFEKKGWGLLQASWHHPVREWDISGWHLDPHKPIEFVIDALAAPMFTMPDQINEFEFKKVTERAKKDLAFKS